MSDTPARKGYAFLAEGLARRSRARDRCLTPRVAPFTKAGKYKYICTVHDNMKGEVDVG